MAEGQILVDHVHERGKQVHEVRGTLIASSLQSLRENGLYDRYVTHLPKERRDEVLYCVANSWLPVEVAMVHYGACEAMNLSDNELTKMGEMVSARIMGTFLGTMLRSTRSVGAAPTPWTLLKVYPRVCDRLLNGGHHIVRELGPKDATVETSVIPMYKYRYFRTACIGLMRGAAGMFAKTIYARELPVGGDQQRIRVGLRWV